MKKLQVVKNNRICVTEKDIADALGFNYDEEYKLLYLGGVQDKNNGIVIEFTNGYIHLYAYINGERRNIAAFMNFSYEDEGYLVYERTENAINFGFQTKDSTKINCSVAKATDQITNEEYVVYVISDNNDYTPNRCYYGDGKIVYFVNDDLKVSADYITLVQFNIPGTSIVAMDIYTSLYADRFPDNNYPVIFNMNGKQYIGLSKTSSNSNRLFLETEIPTDI